MSFHMINIISFYKCISTSNNTRNFTQISLTMMLREAVYTLVSQFSLIQNLKRPPMISIPLEYLEMEVMELFTMENIKMNRKLL